MAYRKLLLLCFLLASVPCGLLGQTSSGALRGVVQNAAGVPIAGASVEVRLPSARLHRVIVSDPRGSFQFQDLAPGRCEITVASRGFAPATAEVTTRLGNTLEIAVTLGSIQQSVLVRARGSSITEQPVDLTGDVRQGVITSHDLETLPLSSRSFANVAYLAPGTEPVEPSDPTKARITAVSTGGSSGLNNELSVDGADNSDDYIGGFLENYSPDAIEELAVRTSEEDADTGGTTAGSVMITTRSGTNSWHGNAAVYERAAPLNARFPIEDPAPNPKQPFSRQNYDTTLGGPILRDHVWFFASVEHVHENASMVYSPSSIAQFDALAALATRRLIPGAGSIQVPTEVPIWFRDTMGMLRFDWTPTSRSMWFLRNSGDSYTTHNSMVQQGALPSTGLLAHNNYFSMAVGNQFQYSPTLVGNFVFGASGLHLTETRSSNLGFALAFPFSSTSLTVSGFETFGDNQLATPITFFPSERNQQKYQLRYDLSHAAREHTVKFGVNLIHEPVLEGAFPGNTETLYQFPQNPTYYLNNPSQFVSDMQAGASNSDLHGGFSENVQRLALYAQDSWRIHRNLMIDVGVRYSTTWALFTGSGRTQAENPGYITLAALKIPLVDGLPQDDRRQVGPRLGFSWTPAKSLTVIRGGFGIYLNDLAQNGWVAAFQAVNTLPAPCVDPVQDPGGGENGGCVAGHSLGGRADLIDPRYRTPYAIHLSGGVQRAFNSTWTLSADYVHEQGNHSYRAYSYTGGTNLFTPSLGEDDPRQAADVPDVNVFHSGNRSSYNALLVHLQANVGNRLSLVTNYTFAKAETWGCVLGELFDYVNGVCDPLDPFGRGDYGPSGEDVRHRLVVAGLWRAGGGFEVSTLTQAETARPFTITTADNRGRIAINGTPTTLDQFRGSPYIQADLRLSRPIAWGEGWAVIPFVEFFNLFNRNNPGANFVTNVATLPVPAAQAEAGNITGVCANPDCSLTKPLISPSQLRVPGGALGDFFGPGTTVGIPFAAQLGARLRF